MSELPKKNSEQIPKTIAKGSSKKECSIQNVDKRLRSSHMKIPFCVPFRFPHPVEILSAPTIHLNASNGLNRYLGFVRITPFP